jgi:hypothetical protein
MGIADSQTWRSPLQPDFTPRASNLAAEEVVVALVLPDFSPCKIAGRLE